jgi:hypothetical protein
MHYARATVTTLYVILIFCIIAFLGTELWPIGFVVQLQLFKTTVLAKVLLLIAVSAISVGWFYIDLSRWIEWLLAALACTFLVGVLVVRDVGKITLSNQALIDCARSRTDESDVFIVPPLADYFRVHARRSIVVDYKAVLFSPPELEEWYRRMGDVTNGAVETKSGSLTSLDEAFHNLTEEKLVATAEKYGASHLLREEPLSESQAFDEVCATAHGFVYALRPAQ